MRLQSVLRKLSFCLAAVIAVSVVPDAGAQAKKQVKTSHATAPDLGNDNHMVAWIIRPSSLVGAQRANEFAPTAGPSRGS